MAHPQSRRPIGASGPRALARDPDARRDPGRGARRAGGHRRARPAPAAVPPRRPTRSRCASWRPDEPDADIGPVGGRRRHRVQVDDQRGQHGRRTPTRNATPGRRLLRLAGRGPHDAEPGLPGLLRLDVDRRACGAPPRSWPRATRPTLNDSRRASPSPTAATSSPCSPTATSSTARLQRPGRRRAWSTVPLQPLPLPTATVEAEVFADVTSANGQYDPGEDGLSGFTGQDRRLHRPGQHRRLRQPAVHARVQRPNATASRPGYDVGVDGEPVVAPPRRQVPLRRRQHGRRRRTRRRRHDYVIWQGLRPAARPRRAARSRTSARTATRCPMVPPTGAELGPDDHARGQPRLGRLGDGGLDRPRHRVRGRRRAVPGHDLRLRPGPTSTYQALPRRPTSWQLTAHRSRPAAPARSRASSTPSRSTSRPGRRLPARHDLGRPVRRQDRQADRRTVDRPLRPRPRRHRRLARPRRRRRHASRSPTCPPAPTR